MPTATLSNQAGPFSEDKWERLKRESAKVADSGLRYRQFKQRYKHDPTGFVRDCIAWEHDEGPYYYQIDVLDLIRDHDRVSWRGPRGCCKTSTVAWVVLWFALVHDGNPRHNWKVGMTASVERQLEKFLWPEIHFWARRLKWEVIGRKAFKENTELMNQSLRLETGEVYSFVSNDPDKVEGAHAADVLLIFDESKAVPEASLNAVMGGVTGAGADTKQKAKVIAVSTPGPPLGWFYDIHRKAERFQNWESRHITQEMCLQAGSLSVEGLEEVARRCGGKGTTEYRRQALGEFAADDVMGIIALDWFEAAVEKGKSWRDDGKPGLMTSLGIDVGDTGADKTVMAPCYGLQVDDLIYRPKLKVENGPSQMMADVGAAKNFLDSHDDAKPVAIVDTNGVGSGFEQRLREVSQEKGHNWETQGFKSQAKPPKKKTFEHPYKGLVPKDAAAAGYLLLAYYLDPDNFEKTGGIGLPDDPQLKLELTSIQRLPEDSEGKTKINKAPNGKSPDAADAVMMAITVNRLAPPKRKMHIYGPELLQKALEEAKKQQLLALNGENGT